MIKYKTPFKLKTVGSGDVLGYQVPTGTVSHIRACTLHNSSDAAIAVEIHIVSENVAGTTANTRIINKNLSSGESYLCPELANHNLQSGDKLFFKGAGINAMLSVMEQNA